MVSSINHINFSRSIQYYHFKAKATNFSRFGYFIFFRRVNVWIGLHEIDPLDGSNVQWVGCEDPVYRNFAVPDTSSTPDDSKCFTVDSTGQWKSERCDQMFGFVCEENMGKLFEFNSFSVNLRCAYREKCRRLLSKYYVAKICDSIVKHSDIVYFQILFLKLATKN